MPVVLDTGRGGNRGKRMRSTEHIAFDHVKTWARHPEGGAAWPTDHCMQTVVADQT